MIYNAVMAGVLALLLLGASYIEHVYGRNVMAACAGGLLLVLLVTCVPLLVAMRQMVRPRRKTTIQLRRNARC